MSAPRHAARARLEFGCWVMAPRFRKKGRVDRSRSVEPIILAPGAVRCPPGERGPTHLLTIEGLPGAGALCGRGELVTPCARPRLTPRREGHGATMDRGRGRRRDGRGGAR